MTNIVTMPASGVERVPLDNLTLQEWKGVWLSDRQLDANEGTIAEALLIVQIDGRLIRSYEWIADWDKGYREWLIPAEVINH